MTKNYAYSFRLLMLYVFAFIALQSCSNDDSNPSFSVEGDITDFGEVSVGYTQEQEISINATDLSENTAISTTGDYKVSINGTDYATSLDISAQEAKGNHTLYVQFAPTAEGQLNGTLSITTPEAEGAEFALTGKGILTTNNYQAFQEEHLAFGDGLNQGMEQTFSLQEDVSHTKKINMYVKLTCPTGGCNDWDVFAHVQVKDPSSGEWYEIGRYITPYGVDNHQLERGFKIDVTDFKSLLHGDVQLRAYVEVWGADGWNVSVDFDYIEGIPDYKYYNIARVIEHDKNSLEGVPYGTDYDPTVFDLTKTITVPDNAKATELRTIITGWGHATPTDPDGRPCAEWCYRTHHILINGTATFSHEMGPIGCGQNEVSPQFGNWQPDRAGWCPGMAVPVRTNKLQSAMAGESFNFEYTFEPWTSDGGNTSGQDGAFYAISTFVVVKSNTEIAKPTVD